MKQGTAHIMVALTMLVWAMTFTSTKTLLAYLGPTTILFSRYVLGFLVLCAIRPRMLRLKRRRDELLFLGAALTGAFGYYLAENTALVFADASFVAVAVSTAPLFTAILSYIVLRDKSLGVRFFAGFVIAIVGIALMSFNGEAGRVTVLGLALCLGAAVLWAIYSIIVKRLADLGYETIATTKRTFAWALPMMVVSMLATEGVPSLDAYAHPLVIGNLLYLGIIASAVCFVTWGLGTKTLGTAKTSAYIYLQTPIAVIAAALILGEPITLAMVIGVVMVMVGLALSEDYDIRIRQLLLQRK